MSSALPQCKVLYTALSMAWLIMDVSDYRSRTSRASITRLEYNIDFSNCTQRVSAQAFCLLLLHLPIHAPTLLYSNIALHGLLRMFLNTFLYIILVFCILMCTL